MLKNHTHLHHRKELALIDEKIITLVHQRNTISGEIGKIKFEGKTKIKQPEIWNAHSQIRNSKIQRLKLDQKMIGKIFKSIHKESIKIQKKVFKDLKKNEK